MTVFAPVSTTIPNHSVRLSQIAICSISSFTFDALAEWPHVAKVVITFLVTATATATLALPLAAFDRVVAEVFEWHHVARILPKCPAQPR